MDLSTIYNYLYDKITLNVFSEDDIKFYINDIVSFLELNEYLADIVFIPDRYKNLGSYHLGERKMNIAIKAIVNEARLVLNMMDDKPHQESMINLFILKTLLHEITHIYHNYLITECDSDIAKVFYLELAYFQSDSEIVAQQYEKHYSKLIFERDANITSVENILRIIKKYVNDPMLYDYYFEYLKHYLLSGYSEDNDTITSPIEIVYGDILHQDMIVADNIDLYDRFRLGFQVNRDEMSYFKDNIDTIIKAKNNLL